MIYAERKTIKRSIMLNLSYENNNSLLNSLKKEVLFLQSAPLKSINSFKTT